MTHLLTSPTSTARRCERASHRLATAAAGIVTLATLLGARVAGAQAGGAEEQGAGQNPRWAAIHRVFGQGEAEGAYFRIDLPRSDLHVRIDDDALDPTFEFRSYVGFVPTDRGRTGLLAMGEIVLRQEEVPAVLAEAHRQGVRVTAVHNHLIGETPRIVYVHVMAEGESETVATRLRAVFAKSATPLAPPQEEASQADWSAIDAVLGTHSEAEGRVAEYVFPRKEALRVHGIPVKSVGTLETASEVVFQQLGGGRVANTGELYLLPGEVEAVERALDAHGLHVTAVHNHMLDDGPPHYWVHWYATGDGATLARGVAAALAQMNGATRAVAEGQE